MPLSDFYSDFQIVSHFPLWRNYLRWSYKKTITDSQKLKIKSIRNRINPTCFLCGSSGEITADEFIKFVLEQNPNVDIKIIDIGDKQTNMISKLIANKYPKEKITVRKTNALNLSFIDDKSVDWIETDGFLGFFNNNDLLKLFKEWKRILKKDGYITFREIIRENSFTSIADSIRDFLAKYYMQIILKELTLKEFSEIVNQTGFVYCKAKSIIPGFQRYCLFLK